MADDPGRIDKFTAWLENINRGIWGLDRPSSPPPAGDGPKDQYEVTGKLTVEVKPSKGEEGHG